METPETMTQILRSTLTLVEYYGGGDPRLEGVRRSIRAAIASLQCSGKTDTAIPMPPKPAVMPTPLIRRRSANR